MFIFRTDKITYLEDYIMLELLKNIMRSTVDFHGVDANKFQLRQSLQMEMKMNM